MSDTHFVDFWQRNNYEPLSLDTAHEPNEWAHLDPNPYFTAPRSPLPGSRRWLAQMATRYFHRDECIETRSARFTYYGPDLDTALARFVEDDMVPGLQRYQKPWECLTVNGGVSVFRNAFSFPCSDPHCGKRVFADVVITYAEID